MAEFKLSAEVTVSAYTVVEAETLDEAIKIGKDREVLIGGYGSGADENESWIVEDADGDAQNIREEE